MTNEILGPAEDGIIHARISGTMTLADQHALESLAKTLIDAGQEVRLLVTLDSFEGWEQDPAWGDELEFQFEYGNKIASIAIVGDERWKDQSLLYVGKGFRSTAIEFFPVGSLGAANAWLNQG